MTGGEDIEKLFSGVYQYCRDGNARLTRAHTHPRKSIEKWQWHKDVTTYPILAKCIFFPRNEKQMKENRYCPYCGEVITRISKDHIFPGFLGGSRTIDTCGTGNRCNNTFGRTIEAGAARFLQPMHVFVSSWGLSLRCADATWESAYFHEGRMYDLIAGKTGVRSELSAPIIEKGGDGRITRGVFM